MTAKIPDDVVERALSIKTDECPEGLQYVLIRGLHAMGFQQCSSETWDLVRAAGEMFVAWEQERIEKVLVQELCGSFVGIRDDLIIAIRALKDT